MKYHVSVTTLRLKSLSFFPNAVIHSTILIDLKPPTSKTFSRSWPTLTTTRAVHLSTQ
jgi:hypothetical protein